MEEMIERFAKLNVSCGGGHGSGYGSLIGAVYNGHKVYSVDDVATIIYRVFGSYAKGAIVNGDMTLTPCYIAKRGNYYAHGETLRKAHEALTEKMLENMPVEDRIVEFRKKFKPNTKYSNRLFWEWHNTLTGSCEMGRNQFAKEHGIDLGAEMTAEEFIKLTKNAYGGEVIRMLEEFYPIGNKMDGKDGDGDSELLEVRMQCTRK